MESGVTEEGEKAAAAATNGGNGDGILLNPHAHEGAGLDPVSGRIMRDTIEWLETRGTHPLPRLHRARRRLRRGQAQGCDRSCQLNEITGFYGPDYWHTWQVTILGLGPILMSDNDASCRTRTARERVEDGFRASGFKRYIGNGSEAGMVSFFQSGLASGAEALRAKVKRTILELKVIRAWNPIPHIA